MAVAEQLGDDSWYVVRAACCPDTPVFAIIHLNILFVFNFVLCLSIPFSYFSLIWYQ